MKIRNYSLLFILADAIIPTPTFATCFPRDSVSITLMKIMALKDKNTKAIQKFAKKLIIPCLALRPLIASFGGGCYFTYHYFKNAWDGEYTTSELTESEEIACNQN